MIRKNPGIGLGTWVRMSLLGLLLTAGSASAQVYVLPVPLIGQNASNWCHAAGIQMVTQYWGVYGYSQCDIVNREFNRFDCPNWTANIYDICNGLNRMGFNCTPIMDDLGFNTVFNQIANGKPIITGINWTSGGGHVRVLTGVDSFRYVKFHDPAGPWSSSWVAFGYYISNSSWYWSGTAYQIR